MLSQVVSENTELVCARTREVIDIFRELPFCETKKARMGERIERGSSCPLLTKGKSFGLWKQEVRAWQIVVEDEHNKKKIAVELAINLPHNHPLKIKERVFDSKEHGIEKLNSETGIDTLLKFLEEKVFYNDPMTDRYKMWQDLSRIARDKNQSMTAYIYEAEASFRRAAEVNLTLPKGLMVLDGAELSQSLKQLVATGCNFSCKNPDTDAPRLYEEIVAGLQKVAGQHAALLGGGDGGVAMFSTNEEAFEVFLASNKGKELVQAAARKARRKSSHSEGDPTAFKCWYCDKEGHAKRDCPKLAEDKRKGVVKRHPWRSSQYKGKGDDGKKTNAEKVKPEKVKMAEEQSDSGSDSSWFVQDVSETIEEAKVKWVTGDGLSEEDTGSTHAMKSVISEAVLITEECELGESVSAPGLVPSVSAPGLVPSVSDEVRAGHSAGKG